MDIEEATAHLRARMNPGDRMDTRGLYYLGWYLDYTSTADFATLDGEFTADDLDAIATYMRHNA